MFRKSDWVGVIATLWKSYNQSPRSSAYPSSLHSCESHHVPMLHEITSPSDITKSPMPTIDVTPL